MAEGDKKNWTLEVIAVIALCIIMWYKLRNKKAIVQPEPITTAPEVINNNPLLDPYKGQPMNCDEGIIQKPLAPYGPTPADFTVGRGYCYRGDGSFFGDAGSRGGENVVYGDPYADVQAQVYSDMKQTETVRNINKQSIQFRLINSTAAKAAVTVLDTTEDTAPFVPPSPTPITYNDWFLPSKDELIAMNDELYLYGIGNLYAGIYWSSSEANFNNTYGTYMGSVNSNYFKSLLQRVRACRAFVSTTNYNLRDIGPAGGYIFWKSGNDYLECSPSDLVNSVWSNIHNIEIGVTAQGTAIGTGLANTTAIIGQVGHIASAALLCKNLVVVN